MQRSGFDDLLLDLMPLLRALLPDLDVVNLLFVEVVQLL